MLDEHETHAGIRRERAQQILKGVQSTRRCADANNRERHTGCSLRRGGRHCRLRDSLLHADVLGRSVHDWAKSLPLNARGRDGDAIVCMRRTPYLSKRELVSRAKQEMNSTGQPCASAPSRRPHSWYHSVVIGGTAFHPRRRRPDHSTALAPRCVVSTVGATRRRPECADEIHCNRRKARHS